MTHLKYLGTVENTYNNNNTTATMTAEKDAKNVRFIYMYVRYMCVVLGERERKTQSTDGPMTDGKPLYKSLARRV